MHQSTGKLVLPEDFKSSRKSAFRSYGLFDKCMDIRRPRADKGSTLFDGKYCSVFFDTEIVLPEELDVPTGGTEQRERRDNWIS